MGGMAQGQRLGIGKIWYPTGMVLLWYPYGIGRIFVLRCYGTGSAMRGYWDIAPRMGF